MNEELLGGRENCGTESTLRRDMDMSIALVGLNFKFPGNAVSEDEFWDMLIHGRINSPSVPPDRFNAQAFPFPKPYNTDPNVTIGGHFIKDDISRFDAKFFGITEAEASAMDPQQRMLLETTYRALENAGISLETIRGSRTSVHIGCFTGDYQTLQFKDQDKIPTYYATGSSNAILSNRISWFFDLNGASMTIDTACSSSLVALHQACEGLRDGTHEMGIVGGCNLMCAPDATIGIAKMGFLSLDSLCHSFDERANGYARGEGIGVLVLKRLSDAIRCGDNIRAVVRSTGMNSDGRTPMLAQPNPIAQESLIKSTYQKAALDLDSTVFVEAHGTGTTVGDLIEASTLEKVFGGSRGKYGPVYIGATKANIGHLEAASGVASIIKAMLVLEKGVIPPIAGLRNLNSRIEAPNLCFPTKCVSWPADQLRRASIQSFGFGGTNAHVILESPNHYLHTNQLSTLRIINNHVALPQSCEQTAPLDKRPCALPSDGASKHAAIPRLIVISSSDKGGIVRSGQLYDALFRIRNKDAFHHPVQIDDIAYTLANRRTHLSWRSFAIASSVEDLQDFSAHLQSPKLSLPGRELALIFTGQGAQWLGMGIELLNYRVFLKSISESGKVLSTLGNKWDLLDCFSRSAKLDIDDPRVSQPLCTALQIAVVDLLRELSIECKVVVGHSSGEIAAAYCIGALTRHAAMAIAYHRGTLSAQLSCSPGQTRKTMMAVGASTDEIVPHLERAATNLREKLDVTVACINSPQNTTIAGSKSQLDELGFKFQSEGIFARQLKVPLAYHTSQMECIAEEYRNLIADALMNLNAAQASASDVTMISSVTATRVSHTQVCRPEYWIQNLTFPVRFNEALNHMIKEYSNLTSLLEVGPHSTLQAPIQEILASNGHISDIGYLSILVRRKCSITCLLKAVGDLWCKGHRINHRNLCMLPYAQNTMRKTLPNLPPYSFQHSNAFWSEGSYSKGHRLRTFAPHPLLGLQFPDWNPLEPRWRMELRTMDLPFLEDHKIDDSVIYPAAAMLASVLQGAHQVSDSENVQGYEITDTTFTRPLVLSSDGSNPVVELYFQKQDNGESQQGSRMMYLFRLYSYNHEQWLIHCAGRLRIEYKASKTHEEPHESRNEGSIYPFRQGQIDQDFSMEHIEASKMYGEILWKSGYHYGPTFQLMRNVYWGNGHVHSELLPLDEAACARAVIPAPYVVHPATLDAVMQLGIVAITNKGASNIPLLIPQRINRLWVCSDGLNVPAKLGFAASARSTLISTRRLHSLASAKCNNTNRLRVTMDIEAAAVARNDIVVPQAIMTKQIGSHLHLGWRPDLGSMSELQIRAHCLQDQEHTVDSTSRQVKLENLEGFLFHAISRCMAKVKGRELVASQPHFERYISWMEFQLERLHKGQLPAIKLRYDLISTEKTSQEALRCIFSDDAETNLYLTVADNLERIIRGELDPMDILFGENYAWQYYEQVALESRSMPALQKYLKLLAHKRSDLRILEVGAGTGAVSAKALESLQLDDGLGSRGYQYSIYDFTDISASFFTTAQQKFGTNNPRLRFRTFDVQRPPQEQGFELGSYDVIIAGSVLHATKDIGVTMNHIKSLLKEDGTVVILEGVQPDRPCVGFVFGLLPGWWLGVESWRKLSPCLTSDQWNNVLQSTGFSGVDLEVKDFESENCHVGSMLITTKRAVAIENLISHNESWILIAVNTYEPTQLSIATTLSRIIQQNLEKRCIIAHMNSISKSLRSIPEICILIDGGNEPILLTNSNSQYESLRRIFSSASSVLWLTANNNESTPAHGMVRGLAQSIRRELRELCFVNVDIESAGDITQTQRDLITRILSQFISGKTCEEIEYKEINGVFNIPRVCLAAELNSRLRDNLPRKETLPQQFDCGKPLTLSITDGGHVGLQSFHFIEDKSVYDGMEDYEVEIEIKAIGCNFRDALQALGRLDVDTFGVEAAGIVARVGRACQKFRPGDPVIAFVQNPYRSYARTNESLIVPLEAGLSFPEGASIPVNFCTAYHALINVARLHKGETILIHSAAGGTGQALVQIAKHLKANIYATVSTDEKREMLIRQYSISPHQIFSSRDRSFEISIKKCTKESGVDVVVNSLSGDLLEASWRCVAPYGRFVEIGKNDILNHGKLDMYRFAKNVTFSAIDLAAMAVDRPEFTGRILQEVVRLFQLGHIKTQDIAIFNISDVDKALRQLISGKTMGKIVVEVTPEAIVKTRLSASPAVLFGHDVTYVIVGAFGGLGKIIAPWMISKGARHLLLLSRSGATQDASQDFVKSLRDLGAQIQSPACDIADKESLLSVLAPYGTSLPRIQGCIQASMVLRDTTFEQMSHSDFTSSLRPKVHGSWNLHELLPQSMDFFIMLSSVVGIVGNGGQSNYGAGCAYQDALAEYRVSMGLSATSIDLTAMESGSYLTLTSRQKERLLRANGLQVLSETEFFWILEYYCDPNTLDRGQVITGLPNLSTLTSLGIQEPFWMSHPCFGPLKVQDSADVSDEPTIDATEGAALQTLLETEPDSHVVEEAIMRELLSRFQILMPGSLDPVNDDMEMMIRKPLHELGVDSLAAIDLRNWLLKDVRADITTFELLEGIRLDALCSLIMERSEFRKIEEEESEV